MFDAEMTTDTAKTQPEPGKDLPLAMQRVGRIAPYVLWSLLTFGAFYWRPPTAPIELETLASAWHMWTDGVWVPLRNDLPAPQIPPLQIWLILAGWKGFGIVTWWPRLLSPVAGLASIWLIGRIARILWPHRNSTAYFSRVLLIGLGGFAIMLTMIAPEPLVQPLIAGGFAIVARLRLMPQKPRQRLTSLIALAALQCAVIMMGGWAVALLIPLTILLLPLFDPGSRVPWRQIAIELLACLLPPLLCAMAWIGQTDLSRDLLRFGNGWLDLATEASRREPWSLLFVPVVLYPWLWWKTLWRALHRSLRGPIGTGLRFSGAFLIAAIITSVMSGGQLQGLLPVAIPLCLIAARLLATQEIKARDFHAVLPSFLALSVGLIFFMMNIVPTAHLDAIWRSLFDVPLPIWLGGIGLTSGLVLLTFGYVLAQISPSHQLLRTLQVALLPSLLLTCLNIEFPGSLAQFFDLTPVASRLQAMQEAGQPIAVYADYRGEFDYQGRLTRAPDVVRTPQQARIWADRHPGGAILTYFDGSPIRLPALPIYRGVARDHWVAIWPANAVSASDGKVLDSSF
jgi:4-amino-4-deoxy-L-arabinose transferase-like glycosyltransferase